MKFPAQMSLVERERKRKKKKSGAEEKKLLEQQSVGYSAGGVEVFMFSHAMNSDLLIAETD